MVENSSTQRLTRLLFVLLVVSWLVRLEFIAILPSYAYSYDISCFEDLALTLGTGGNPYATTPCYFAWPPFWMIVLYGLDRIAELGSFKLIEVLRAFLIVAESIALILAWKLASREAPGVNWRGMLLFGFALNPIAILLTIQHGNFDIVVAVWVMLAVLALQTFQRSREPGDWLLACLFLGMGVLTKTVPLVLAPLLIPGARAMNWRERFLGGVLFLGPTALGIGVVYALEPGPIIDRVIFYTSFAGRFGFSGLAKVFGMTGVFAFLRPAISLAFLSLLVWGCVKAWSWTRVLDRQITLLAGLILFALPAIGPGFAPQYASWFMPLLAVSYVSGSRRWKGSLIITFVVSSLTYLVYYAFARDLGGFLVYMWDSPTAIELGKLITEEEPRVWLTLPMFASWLALLVAGIREVRDSASDRDSLSVEPGSPA